MTDDLARRLLRYVGHDRRASSLRDLVRYGHEMDDRERALAERALCATPTPAGRRHPTDTEETTVSKIAQAESVEVWEAGMYPAEVLSCEETKSTWPGKEGTPRFKWVLRIKSAGGEYTDVWHWTGATFSKHPNATLRPFVKAVLPDADLDGDDVDLDTDDLVGKVCRVILGINEEKGRNVIDKVLPAEGQQGKVAPVAARATNPVPTVAQRRAAQAAPPSEDDIPF